MPFEITESKVVGYKYQNDSYIPIQKYKLKYVGKKISDKEIQEISDLLYKETLNIKKEEELKEYLENSLLDLNLKIFNTIEIIMNILEKRGFI
jgi:hypothetical protein